MATPTDDIAALDARASELEREITRRRGRLASLVGLRDEVAPSAIPAALHVEVAISTPPLARARAQAELFRALHEETGIVGAVLAESDRMEWRPLDRASAGSALEVDFETSSGGATLRLRDRFGSARTHTEMVFALSAASVPIMFVVFALLDRTFDWPRPLSLGLVLALALTGPLLAVPWMRWRTRKALEELAARLADRLPRAGAPSVRVDPTLDAQEEAADELHEGSARRAVP